MKGTRHENLPLAPLLHAYLDAGVPDEEALVRLPGLGRRFQAILTASQGLLDDAWLRQASDGAFQTRVVSFYDAVVDPPLHAERVQRRARTIRLALGVFREGTAPLAQRLAGCLSPDGPGYVAGVGPTFWTALLVALDPRRHAGWTPAVVKGLRRLGLLAPSPHDNPERVYSLILDATARLRAAAPTLTALHCEHFLTLVSLMEGRQLLAGSSRLSLTPDLGAAAREERARHSLRDRLKERGQSLAEAQEQIRSALAGRDGKQIVSALAAADPDGSASTLLDWSVHGETLSEWLGKLQDADDPWPLLSSFWESEPIPGAGLWLPAAALHLRDPQSYPLWNDGCRAGMTALDDGAEAGPLVERYRLHCESVAWLRQHHSLHPLEIPALLAKLAETGGEEEAVSCFFGGFCADTFRFLRELKHNNSRGWMETQRDRYHFVLRQPLVELCQALRERYVEPVLRGRHRLDLETEARDGMALTRLTKNDHGRSSPYNTDFWIAFCSRAADGRRHPTQFFVRVDSGGLHCGLRLGATSSRERSAQRQRLLSRAEGMFDMLQQRSAFEECRLLGDDASPAAPGLDGFRLWLSSRSPSVIRSLPPESPLLLGDSLVGEVLLTFDRLLPLYLAAVSETEPSPEPAKRSDFTAAEFVRATHLSEEWLNRARSLLQLKRQVILQGVPGTGKTHVARCLARLLAGGAPEAVCLAQMHPAYSYEEFVEGIRVKSVESNGRHDVTYPVEDGLLCSFAAKAAAQPSQPHILVLDEINRANLPRVLGELLFLLEYRDQEVVLPCSRRRFRLPPNLYLIGTMNAADRSVAAVDQALRRRFSFLEMPPDATVLRAWLKDHPPVNPGYAEEVIVLFEHLNDRLRAELGPTCQVGHSYFMVPKLDEARLEEVWQHQVRPLLQEFCLLHPGRTVPLDRGAFLPGERRRPPGRKRQFV